MNAVRRGRALLLSPPNEAIFRTGSSYDAAILQGFSRISMSAQIAPPPTFPAMPPDGAAPPPAVISHKTGPSMGVGSGL